MTAPAEISYDYWQNALNGVFGPIHEGQPQPGFYRKRIGRGGPFVPVAIFVHDGALVALVNGGPTDAAAVWSFVAQYPVTEEVYHAKMAGEPWPDESEHVTASLGHNQGPTDEVEILRGQIDAAKAGVAEYAEIKDDETAAKAQSLRSRLLELSGNADRSREAEKKPFLEGGKAVDAKWQPLIRDAKTAADTLRSTISAHETRKAKAEAAARETAEAAARAAAKAATAKGEPPPPIPRPVPQAAPQTAIKGAYGRAAAVKVVKIVSVVDQDAVYGFMKDHKELKELIAKLAQRAVDAGYAVPGTTITEERAIR